MENLVTKDGAIYDELCYYSEQGVMTDPGEYASLYEGLPDEVGEILEGFKGSLFMVKKENNMMLIFLLTKVMKNY